MTKFKYGNSGAYIGQGANIAKNAYKADADVPSQHENDAQFFSKFGEMFSAPGDRPRGIWRNLGAGLAEGAAHASRSKAIKEKKDKNDKYQQVMEYFQAANNAALKQNQWYEKRAAAKQEMMPQVLAYMDNIDRLDPQSQRIMAQDMLAQYGTAIGENFKLSSIDGSNPFLMTIQSDKGQQLFDLRSMFAGDEAIQQSIAMKMPEYQMKLQQERADKEREFKLKEELLGAKKQEIAAKHAAPEGSEYGSIPIKSLPKGTASIMSTINADMKLAQEIPVIMHQIDEAEQIIAENPQLGRGWANFLAKGFPTGMSDKLRTAYEKLNKISSRVAEAFIRSKGGAISDSERETIKKGLFDATLLPGSNQYNIDSIRQELIRAKEYGHFAGQELARGYIATPVAFENYLKRKTDSAVSERDMGDDPFLNWTEVQ